MIRILISLGLLLGAVAPVAAQDVKCDPGGNQLELNASLTASSSRPMPN